MLTQFTVFFSLATVAVSPLSVEAIPPENLRAENPVLEVGTVQNLNTGDIMCYATLIDENDVEYNIGASFEICQESENYLNQKVRLTYEEVNVNDCQSNDPCGKTRQEQIITEMEILE